MKKCKKLLALTMAVLLAFACFALPSFATSSGSQYGLEATIVTDKESYKANEEIHVTVTVKNTNDFKVEDVSIESLLSETLTLKDGSSSTKTVDLEAGETLTLSFTAVKEKEETSATVPESEGTTPTETETVKPSESETDKPTETETVKPSETETAKPTETETIKPTETQQPSTQESTEQPTQAPTTEQPTQTTTAPITTTTAPFTTGEATTLPSTTGTPSTTGGGIIGDLTTTFPKVTTTADSTTTAQAENPNTGDSMSVKTLVIAIIALLAAIVVVIIFMYKYKKQTTKIISLVMCVAIAATAITGVSFFTAKGADDERKSFTVEKVITVDGEETKVNATVKYQEQKQTETELGLVIDQKDFTTTEYKQTITGYFDPNKNVVSVSYSIKADIDKGKVSKTGIAILSGNKWKIKDIELKGDRNVIVVTAKDKAGAIETKKINVTFDMGDSYRTNPDAVRTDKETGIRYVNNIIVVTCRNDITEEEKETVAKLVSGKIVGRFNFTDTIYIEIKSSSLSEIEDLCEILERNTNVMRADYMRMMKIDTLSVSPNDPWEIKHLENKQDKNVLNPPDDWDSIQVPPKGTNWGLLATDVPNAWGEYIRFSPINIGIVDSGFDVEHTDLKGAIEFPSEKYENENNVQSKDSEGNDITNSHGTGVAGIIGANANNGKGISGIVWDGPMYCVDWTPNDNITSEEADRTIYEGIEAVVNAGAKIINLSIGNGETYAPNEEEELKRDMQHYGEKTAELIAKLLSEGKDFLLVAGAGNNERDARENPYFTSVTEKTAKKAAEKYKVPVQDILDRIIVVGAVSYEGYSEERGYRLCDSSTCGWGSNWGDSVDICAPGMHLLSTAVNDKYQHFSGTSAATPIVSGIAGMIWSVNKDFTGAEVKEILLSKTQPAYRNGDSRTYKMVNARLSVNEAIRRADAKGTVQGRFIDAETNEPLQAEFVVREEASNGKLYNKLTYTADSEGNFTVSLPQGHFVLEVHVEDYITNYVDVYPRANSKITLGDVEINKESGVIPPDPTDPTPGIDDKFAGGDGSVENPYQIATIEQLDAVRNHLNSHFILLNDINFAGFLDENGEQKYFSPIGRKEEYGAPFTGTFDGKGHTIKNLKMRGSYVGLFVSLENSIVQNLNLQSVSVRGDYSVGTIASTSKNSVIKNCNVRGNIEYGGFISTGWPAVGGISGMFEDGSLNNCYFTGNIQSAKIYKTGGITGWNSGEIINCGYNGGYCYGGYATGGIAGYNHGKIINCFNKAFIGSNYMGGTTDGISPYMYQAFGGGIAAYNSGVIERCYNTGSIYGWSLDDYYIGKISGIVADNQGTISYCYNRGNVYQTHGRPDREDCDDVESIVAGITSRNKGEIFNCYNTGNLDSDTIAYYFGTVPGTTGVKNVYFSDSIYTNYERYGYKDGGERRSEQEMKSDRFVGLLNEGASYFVKDTKEINNGYPILRWQNS